MSDLPSADRALVVKTSQSRSQPCHREREPTVEELAEALIERKGPPSDWLMPVIRKWFPDASGPDRVMMVLAFDEAIRGVVSDE